MTGEGGRTVSRAEIARFAEVTTAAVSNWQRRHPADFPSPSSDDRFSVAEVAAWLDRRKIAADSRHDHEPPEATFGERFRANLAGGGTPPAPAAEAVPPERFFLELNRARQHVDESSHREFVLGLIYLRAAAPEEWRRFREAPAGALPGRLGGAFQRNGMAPVPDLDGAVLAHLIALIDREPARDDVLFDQVLEQLSGRWGSEFHTPQSIVRTMLALVRPQPGGSVHDPWCAAGNLLSAAAKSADGVRVSGFAYSSRSWRLARMNLALHGIEHPDLGDGPTNSLLEPPSRERFDVVLTNPPFGINGWTEVEPGDPRRRYGSPPRKRADLAWPQHCLHLLAPGGRAAVLMPAGASFRGGREQQIRAEMLRQGAVEAVIGLPPGLFEATGIPVQLWLLRRPEDRGERQPVLLVDAGELGELTNRTRRSLRPAEISRISALHARFLRDEPLADELGAVADFEAVEARDFRLNPAAYTADRHVAPASPESARRTSDELDALAGLVSARDAAVERALRGPAGNSTGWPWRPLHEVCEITAGPGNSYRDRLGDAGTPLLTPKDIAGDRIDAAEPPNKLADRDLVKRLERYELRAGDVVCVRTGSLGRQALITGDQAGWLLGTGCMRLRPRGGEINGRFLVHYLGTPRARDRISRHARGGTVPSLSVKIMSTIPVPVPPRDVQDAIAELLGALDDKISLHEQIRRGAEDLRNQLAARIGFDDLPLGLP